MTKPPVSYGNTVKLTPRRLSQSEKPLMAPPDRSNLLLGRNYPHHRGKGAPGRRRPMESRSDPTVLYLHPEGKYELKRYALARGPKVKVHDLIMEAVKEWAGRHGIAAPFRVPSERPRRSS